LPAIKWRKNNGEWVAYGGCHFWGEERERVLLLKTTPDDKIISQTATPQSSNYMYCTAYMCPSNAIIGRKILNMPQFVNCGFVPL